MVGIVVVSHSPRLAEAAVELSLEMVHGERPRIAVAAGAGEDVIGTDAVRVSEAIREVAEASGVLVLMDLGSALLSAEMALEFLPDLDVPIRLSAAPFVEGLIAAVVLAAAGASLDEVAREAEAGLEAKRSQLGDQSGPEAPAAGGAEPDPGSGGGGGISTEQTLRNPSGLHARPAATLASTAAEFDADVTISNVTSGRGPVAAKSPIAIMTLDARKGDTVRITASGRQAEVAVASLEALIVSGFGEITESAG